MTESLIEGSNAGRLDLVLIALPFETGSLEILPLFEVGYQLASPADWLAPRGPEALTESGQLMLLEKGHCLQRHALAAYPGRIDVAEDNFAATSLTTLPDACPRQFVLAWRRPLPCGRNCSAGWSRFYRPR